MTSRFPINQKEESAIYAGNAILFSMLGICLDLYRLRVDLSAS